MPSFGRGIEVEWNGSGGEFLCIATFLPLRSWRYVIPFLSMSARVQKQLKQTRDLAMYGVKVDPFRKRFWIFTVWKDKVSVDSFVPAEPHAEAVRRFKDWSGEGAAFVEWNSTNGSIDWDAAMEKLKNLHILLQTILKQLRSRSSICERRSRIDSF